MQRVLHVCTDVGATLDPFPPSAPCPWLPLSKHTEGNQLAISSAWCYCTLTGPCAGPGVAGSPVEIRRAALVSCRRLLPRMHLAGYSSNILHPLLRVLDGSVDELRTDALDTICSLALALGPDFPIFAPTVRKVRV